MDYTNWSSGQPDNWLGGQNCLVMWPSGQWEDNFCANGLPGMCEVVYAC